MSILVERLQLHQYYMYLMIGNFFCIHWVKNTKELIVHIQNLNENKKKPHISLCFVGVRVKFSFVINNEYELSLYIGYMYMCVSSGNR